MFLPGISHIKNVMVEGNVGAGKSTFLRIIGQALHVPVVYEPHEKWQTINASENLLDAFYKDPHRWAYTFQSYAFVTRVMEQERAERLNHEKPIQLFERSVYSDRYCFAQNCFETGLMSSLEWSIYTEWFDWLVQTYVHKPAGFIYLRTDPQVCYARMVKRNRVEETAVSLDYIERLHQKHEDWLVHKKGVAPYLQKTPVLVLNGNADFEHNKEEQKKYSTAIKDFFTELIAMEDREGN
jgi:deoxyadenosine/deoxycytidine kinase